LLFDIYWVLEAGLFKIPVTYIEANYFKPGLTLGIERLVLLGERIMSSNVNNESTNLYNSLIQRAKAKKDESQQVLTDFRAGAQEKITAARKEITDLEKQIDGYKQSLEKFEKDIAAKNAEIERTRNGRFAHFKRTKMQADQTELDKLNMGKTATTAMKNSAKIEVKIAQLEARLAEEDHTKGLNHKGPSYFEAQQMFEVVAHIDKVIRLKKSGQNYSQDLTNLNTKMRGVEISTADKMGSEFVTKFWEDVEKGLLKLKDTSTTEINTQPNS
jgi:predicted RNase H-like nuclease (RuvC/YqgF family)